MTALDDYESYIQRKGFKPITSGFVPSGVSEKLFPFQRSIVEWACKKGRAAIFAATGLGKTAMQLEWARLVAEENNAPVLIVTPLAVAKQTEREANKFGISLVEYVRSDDGIDRDTAAIYVTNYEMLGAFDKSLFCGVVLDESSILKNSTGKTRTAIIKSFKNTRYKLSCTATPSPNDHMELGNQAEFVGIMSTTEMLAMFFTHDGGDTSKWRLKGHGKTRFWEWLATWAVTIQKPSDIGFCDDGYDLPPYVIHEHSVSDAHVPDGQLFGEIALTMNDRRAAKRRTLQDRVDSIADIVNASDEEWLIWCHLNDEQDALVSAIPDAVSVAGSDDIETKESRLLGFGNREFRVLVSKPSICGFGMNWQHCRNIAFVGLDDSFEQQYQAIRRCWRFGQSREVHVHYATSDSLGAIKQNVERKERQMAEMHEGMVAHMRGIMQREIKGTVMEKSEHKRQVKTGEGWAMHHGDCVEVLREVEDESVGYTIFSPPFASLYTYSNSDYDMGNCRDDDEFMGQFRFLVSELYRVTKPGRLLSFHCMNLPTSKQNHGFIGVRDFRGELIRMFVELGWIFHSEVCIWKDPVTAMQRTKALGLLHKQIKKDSAMSRQGIPDYLVTMRKPGENPDPIQNTNETFPVSLWQNFASPVWMDINPSRTLNYREAREDDDERHICPLQLDVIERGLKLWSREGDLVLSPFAGIGSEGFCALKMGRRFIGAELKESYWNIACQNLDAAERQGGELFVDSEPKVVSA
jgi:DNA modification methylase